MQNVLVKFGLWHKHCLCERILLQWAGREGEREKKKTTTKKHLLGCRQGRASWVAQVALQFPGDNKEGLGWFNTTFEGTSKVGWRREMGRLSEVICKLGMVNEVGKGYKRSQAALDLTNSWFCGVAGRGGKVSVVSQELGYLGAAVAGLQPEQKGSSFMKHQAAFWEILLIAIKTGQLGWLEFLLNYFPA